MNDYPYKLFETKKIWKIVNKAIDDLVKNQDIKETTHRRYIVGYICKLLSEAGAIVRPKRQGKKI